MINEKVVSIIEENIFIEKKRFLIKDFENILGIIRDSNSKELGEADKKIQVFKKQKPLSPMLNFITIFIGIKKKEDKQQEIQSFISFFDKEEKYSIIVYFLEEILKIYSNLSLLNQFSKYQILLDYKEEDILDTYEKILKLDSKNTELIMKLAVSHSKVNVKQAINYYKMAMRQYLQNNNFTQCEKVLNQLIILNEAETSYYFSFLKIISASPNKNFIIGVHEKLLHLFQRNEDIKSQLLLLESILDRKIEIPGMDLRDQFLEVMKLYYKDHKQFDEALQFSRLSKNWVNVDVAYKSFNQLIAYEKGAFVHHTSFGYGVILDIQFPINSKVEEVEKSKIYIDFENKKNHMMTLRIANNSLKILTKDNLIGLKFFDKEGFLKLLESNNIKEKVDALLNTVDPGKNAQDIKALLCPNVIEEDKWNRFFSPIKTELESNSQYFVSKGKEYSYNLMGNDFEREIIEKYGQLKDIGSKLEVVLFIDNNYPNIPIIDQLSKDMESIFTQEEDKVKLSIYGEFFKRKFSLKTPVDPKILFQENFKKIDITFYSSLKDDLQYIYLDLMSSLEKSENYLKQIYFVLENTHLKYTLNLLDKKKAYKKIEEMYKRSLKEVRINPKSLIHISQYILNNREHSIKVDMLEMYQQLVYLLESLYRQYSTEDEKQDLKKSYNKVKYLLFESDFYDFIENKVLKENAISLLKKLSGYGFLDNYLKVEIREMIAKIDSQ